MSIKPGSQTKLLQITCDSPSTNTTFETLYSLYSEPTHIVYMTNQSQECINSQKSIVNKNVYCNNHFNINEIYQVKSNDNAFF